LLWIGAVQFHNDVNYDTNCYDVLMVTLCAELEDLQQAALFAAEEHDRNMRAHGLQIESRMRELEMKSSELEKLKFENEAEKAQNYVEKQEVFLSF
jgi:hypothetical protein